MSGDKTEWPTRTRIAKLRSEGIIAYSTFFTRAMTLIVVLLTVVVFSFRLPALMSLSTKAFDSANSPGVSLVVLKPLLKFAIEYILILTGATLLASIVLILVQSRFFFSFSQVSFQLSRVAAFLKCNPLGAVLQIFRRLLLLVLALLVGVTIIWWYAYDLLVLFNYERSEWPVGLYHLCYTLIFGVSSGVLVLGVLGYGWVRLRFLQENKMTRREADLESD